MNTRNVALGIVAIGVIGAGIWWISQPAPAPAPEKPVIAAMPTTPAPKVAASVVQPKAVVAAPVIAPAIPSASPQVAAAPSTDADLNATLNQLITDLDSQDVSGFVQDFLVPASMDTARAAVNRRMQNVTPEMQAQIEQMMQQQMPQMVQRITQQMSQNPSTLQGFQDLGAALKQVQGTPPQMNDAGDQATYTLPPSAGKALPSSVTFVRKDGKWVFDIASMAQAAGAQ